MSLQVWLPLNGNTSNQGLNGLSMIGSPNSWGDGKIGKCATFNGNLIYNNTTELNYTDNFSYCLWINQNYSGAVGEFAFTVGRVDTGGYGYGIQIHSASLIGLWFGSRRIDISCPANEWHHVALTVSGTTIKVYKDGALLTTSTTQTLPTYSDGKGLGLGCFHYIDGDIYAYHGSLNDFRIYDHCLSAREVKEISKGLVCHYLMNQPEQSPNLSTLPSYIPDFPNGAGTSVFSSSTDGISRRLTCTTSGSGGRYNSCFSNSERLENTTYTWSVDIRASKSMSVSIGLEGGGEVNVTLTTDWQRLSKTAVLSTDSYSAFIIYPHTNAAVGDWIEAKLLKVEKNNFATSWSPCSSDYPKWPDNIEYDCSGYRNDGNRVGGILPSESEGRYSISTYCNSTNIGINTAEGAAFIRCTLANPIKNATTLTINWWGNIEDYSFQDSGILSLSNDSSYPIDYDTSALAQYDSVFRFNLTDGNDSSISSLTLIETGTWHMYTLVFNNGIVQGYRDGISVISNSKSGTLAQFAYVYIGINAAGRVYRQTKSKWSDFRIYSTALSASDIKELYSTSASIDKNGNMYAYEFKEE